MYPSIISINGYKKATMPIKLSLSGFLLLYSKFIKFMTSFNLV